VDFEIVGDIQHIETMAVGSHIRDLTYLPKAYPAESLWSWSLEKAERDRLCEIAQKTFSPLC